MKSKAFTLAEVLITLGIIGVVAAMTLPTLQQKIQYKKYESGYKVAENLIHNAVNYLHSQDKMIDGGLYRTANSNGNVQYEVFSEVLAEAFHGIHALNKNGSGSYADDKYYNFKNNTKFTQYLLDDGYMELANGMSIIVETEASARLPIIFFDINGTANKPNRMGYDTFAFVIDKKDRVCPLGSKACTGRAEYIENTEDFTKSKYCSPKSTSNFNGITCGYFASVDKDFFKKLR